MRHRLALGTGLGLVAMGVLGAGVWNNLGCGALRACAYEGRAFRFTVVDAETKQPLADVHALAEWVLEGFHGKNGPLMVQDAVSGPDGVVAFPAWGPISGPASGLVLNMDPAISLFKAGYQTRLIQNAYPPDMRETSRVRVFGQDGQTFALERFRGDPKAWMEQLRRAAAPPTTGRASDEQLRPFRTPHLNRLQRVRAGAASLPRNDRVIQNFLSSLDREIQSWEEGSQ